MRLGCFFVIFFLLSLSTSFAQSLNEADLKKEALKSFENEDYSSAYKLYSQLVSLYPKDPDYNFHIGVCMLYIEPDKKKPFSYLKLAASSPKDSPKESKFYLAKTYHINYQFDEAIKLYNDYKQIGSSSSIKRLEVDREIEACKNGKRLLSSLTDLEVVNKKQLNKADYFRSYDIKNIGGKLLVKPDDYISSIDKKKKESSVIYLSSQGDFIYYSSYGESGSTGKDIYVVTKLENGTWTKPQMLPTTINTNFDEDFPFLHPNGKTLYFASKGHNSMGGYDIFKSDFNDENQTWSKPINLEFPINSPDDDILFVTDSLEKQAFFSTSRYSPFGKIDVLKINTDRRQIDIAFINGKVSKEDPEQSLKSKVTVKENETGKLIGVFQALDNGNYSIELQNGINYLFTVETPGMDIQSQEIQIPAAQSLKPYNQEITYSDKKLKIINYFDEEMADNNYSVMLDLIEKKAKLEVNENEVNKNPMQTQTDVVDNNTISAVNTTKPVINNDNKVNANKGVTNQELLSIAKHDAQEASEETVKLKQQAQTAFNLANQKTSEAIETEKMADEAMEKALLINDSILKTREVSKANDLKQEAKIDARVANTATNLAKILEADAITKQKETDLTQEYIHQLELITTNKNNSEALAKLEKIQKELDLISKQKNQSDELFLSLKAQGDIKTTAYSTAQNRTENLLQEVEQMKLEVKTLQSDLAKEKDKSIKENISAQIVELNSDIENKNKEIASAEQASARLKNEATGIEKEIDVASKILNQQSETFVYNDEKIETTDAANPSKLKTSSSEQPINKTDVKDISNKYEPTINSVAINKEDAINQNGVLDNYNKEITMAINANRLALTSSSNDNDKKIISNEIEMLEQLKTKNDDRILANNAKIKEFESIALAGSETKTIAPTNTVAPVEVTTIAVVDLNTNAPSKIELNQTVTNQIITLPIGTDQQVINEATNQAEQLNEEALSIRQAAITKPAEERAADIKRAVELESQAVTKKIDIANKQQLLNISTFVSNQKKLEELQQVAKGYDIKELEIAEMQTNEAILYFNKAKQKRDEANYYPTDFSKLGGYVSAEENENVALSKQQTILDIYAKYFLNNKLIKPIEEIEAGQRKENLTDQEKKVETYNEQIVEDLRRLSSANQNAFQNKLSEIPENLSPGQLSTKNKAEQLFTRSKQLLTQANKTYDASKKKELMVEVNLTEKKAINLLDQLMTSDLSPDASETNNLASEIDANSTENRVKNNLTSSNNLPEINVEGFETKKVSVYNISNPIPIDSKFNDGLIFKVQIGAFKQALPNDAFKGISPIVAQTTPSGYLRYMAGNFEKYEGAYTVKNYLKNAGYKDAFIVAYLNGVRITLNEALDKAKANGQTISIAQNTEVVNTNNPVPSVVSNTTNTALVEVAKELEQTNGLLYTIQIGLFGSQATRTQLFNLTPIYSEKLPNGLFRYTAGIYNNPETLLQDKFKVVNTVGIKDAFVTAYYNSKRIPFTEGKKIQADNVNVKMETQNPIVFPEAVIQTTPLIQTPAPIQTNVTLDPNRVQPFTNGVQSGPTPTAENGVKSDDSGISYRVQIGAYKNQVPNEVAASFLNIKTWPVNAIIINELYIYTIGNFNDINFAKKLRDEAILLGISDSFISVYKDGKKLYGTEATQYLNK
jgi:hypothetical protein